MNDLEIEFKDGKAVFDTDNFIWQAYAKSDLDQENKLTREEWLEFCRQNGTAFAEIVADSAHGLFNDFLKEKGKYE